MSWAVESALRSGLALVVSAVGLLPLAWFLWRGGIIPWTLGVFVGAFWAWYVGTTILGIG